MSLLFFTFVLKYELSELPHNNEVFVIMILSCIQVTRREYLRLDFTCVCRPTFLQASNKASLFFSTVGLV